MEEDKISERFYDKTCEVYTIENQINFNHSSSEITSAEFNNTQNFKLNQIINNINGNNSYNSLKNNSTQNQTEVNSNINDNKNIKTEEQSYENDYQEYENFFCNDKENELPDQKMFPVQEDEDLHNINMAEIKRNDQSNFNIDIENDESSLNKELSYNNQNFISRSNRYISIHENFESSNLNQGYSSVNPNDEFKSKT